MSTLSLWVPEDRFDLLRRHNHRHRLITKHTIRTRRLAGKKSQLDRRQHAFDLVQQGQQQYRHCSRVVTTCGTDLRTHRSQQSSSSSLITSSSPSYSWIVTCGSTTLHRWNLDRIPLPTRTVQSPSLLSSLSSELVFESLMAATTSFSALVPTPLTTTGHFSASLSTSSLSTSDEYDSWNNTVPSGPMTNLALGVSHRSGARPNMGAGGRGTIGGGNGGADSPDPSGVHPGQQGSSDSDGGGNGGGNSGEDDENQDFTDEGGKKLPSSYTFRRRNAVVEGSEDAPRAKDYPNASTN